MFLISGRAIFKLEMQQAENDSHFCFASPTVFGCVSRFLLFVAIYDFKNLTRSLDLFQVLAALEFSPAAD